MHRNRNPCNSFLMFKMASSMDHGRVRPTTTTTTNDVAQHGGHLANIYQVMQSWITALIKTITKFSNVIGYQQPDLSINNIQATISAF